MVLESQECKAALHGRGRSSIYALSRRTPYRTAQTRAQEPAIPSPDLFDLDADDEFQARTPGDIRRLPVVAACAAHLELLEVLFVLRQKVLASQAVDKAMGIEPARQVKVGPGGNTKTLKDKTLWARRQAKWTKYVEFAAVRFLTWQRALAQRPADMAVETDEGCVLTHLPPIDVIMVWHSFMLNPRLFAETCREEPLYRIRMPWRLVHASIDSRNWVMVLGSEAEARFQSQAGVPTDLFDQLASWTPRQDQDSEKKPASDLDKLSLAARHKVLDAMTAGDSLAAKYANLFKSIDSSLAVKLRDAVGRQASFIDKMNAHMWIRSPALPGTLRRAIGRYGKFLTLLREHQDSMMVPVLDIDLVWHTHQCAAMFYARGIKAIVGRFVNHDDSIAEETLGTGFGESQKLFLMRFGQQYRICGCWDCEALISGLEDAADLDADEVDMAEIARRAREQVTYYRAVEVAVRGKKPLPVPD